MGILETIDALELSDDVKERLRREHTGEIESKDTELDTLRSRDRRSDVERELGEYKGIGLADPGIQKFLRRVFLSADAEEPGAVLLGDNELNLSGDDATGKGKEEVSVAGTLREFIKLLPRNTQGKLDLGSMALADDANDRPADDSNDDADATRKREERKESSEGWLGHPIQRSRNRYDRRARMAKAAGGDS